MHSKTTLTLALAATFALVGFVPGPAMAVDPDCDEDFQITTTIDQRNLDVSEEETGKAEVPSSGDMILKVELLTLTEDAELSFLVSEEDLGQCVATQNSQDCSTVQKLDKAHSVRECTLPAPLIGVRPYWVPLENTGSEKVDFEISISTA